MPHLRRRLILILVSALGIACFITSVSTYATLQNSLRAQIGSTLKETANRAANPNNSPSGHGFECLDKSNPKTLSIRRVRVPEPLIFASIDRASTNFRGI